jgi:hypothetical protein
MSENKGIDLRILLKEWTDPDITQYYLACCLSLMEYDDGFVNFRKSKHVFWTKDQVGSLLIAMLSVLVDSGLIEFDPNESKYRWNESFGGSE